MHMQVIAPSRAPAALMAIAVQGLLIYGLGVGLGVVPKPSLPHQSDVVFVPTETIEPEPTPLTPPEFASAGFTTQRPELIPIEVDTLPPPPNQPIAVETGGTPIVPVVADTSYLQARVLRSTEPPYPDASVRRGEEGVVYVRIWLSAGGRIDDAKIERSSGFTRLDEAALKAVHAWKFAPATRGGQGVGTSVIVPVKFELRQ